MKLQVTGWGSGPQVVLIHGSLFSAEVTWSAQRALGERWTVLVPNRRGFGDSPPAEGEDFEVDAGDIIELLEEPAHVVGHSYGGIVGMLAAARAPHLVRSLTVIEAPVYQVAAHIPEVASYLQRSKERQDRPRDPEAFLREFLGPREGGYSQDLLQGAQLMLNQRRPWEADIPFDQLANAPFPKLVISVGHSPIHETTCDAVAERLAAERTVLRGKGHVVQRADGFHEALEAFFAKARKGG